MQTTTSNQFTGSNKLPLQPKHRFQPKHWFKPKRSIKPHYYLTRPDQTMLQRNEHPQSRQLRYGCLFALTRPGILHLIATGEHFFLKNLVAIRLLLSSKSHKISVFCQRSTQLLKTTCLLAFDTYKFGKIHTFLSKNTFSKLFYALLPRNTT